MQCVYTYTHSNMCKKLWMLKKKSMQNALILEKKKSFVLSLFFQNSVEFCSSLPCAFQKYCLPEPVRGQGSFCRSLQAICFQHVLENYHISSRLIQLCLPIAKDNLFQKRQNVAALYKNCRLENKIFLFIFFFCTVENILLYTTQLRIGRQLRGFQYRLCRSLCTLCHRIFVDAVLST